MSEFVLEIYGEEIPSSAQKLGSKEFENLFSTFLNENNINFLKLNVFSTARRFTIFIEKISNLTKPEISEIKGPQTSANEKAINGFLKSNNIKSSKELKKKIFNNKEYFIFFKKKPSIKVADILKRNIPDILSSIKWKKSMRWSAFDEKWIRPIKNIFCIFDNKKISFKFAGISSDIYVFGNYQYSNKKQKCKNLNSYKKIMKDSKVILDGHERKRIIYKQLENFCVLNKLKNEFDDRLVTKVSDSVEFPNLFVGKYDQTYFKLPNFLLKTIISDKQDYFYFQKNDKELENSFGFVSNKAKDKNKILISGNQKVLKARFSDALFFINEDRRLTLLDRVEKLKGIIFYDGVGNLFDRVHRIVVLTKIISTRIGLKVDDKTIKELKIALSDLSTEMVKEFPSLQGLVGGYYASLEGFKSEVCLAISQQYFTNFSHSENNKLSFCLSLAQKMDNIFGFFLSQKKLTGAGDPFGLRRSVLSIIKISIEKELNIDFSKIFDDCKKLFETQKLYEKINFHEITNFFNKRLTVFLLNNDFSNDLIKSNLSGKSFNPYLTYRSLKIFDSFTKTSKGKSFMQALKRLESIVPSKTDFKELDVKLFETREENILN